MVEIRQNLITVGNEFICHPLAQHIDQITEAGMLMVEAARNIDMLRRNLMEAMAVIHELNSQPDFLSQALNEGDGVYRP